MKTNYSFSRSEVSRFMMKAIIDGGHIKGDGVVRAEFTIDPDNNEEFATVTVSQSEEFQCDECEEAKEKENPFAAIFDEIISDIIAKRPKGKGN